MKKIFISYSRKDKKWKDEVVKHLDVLKHELDVWCDDRIETGDSCQLEIETALDTADAAVLLISKDFLTSRFIMNTEVPNILKRRAREGILVLPLIVEQCAWQRIEWLAGIQVYPREGKAFEKYNQAERNELLRDFAIQTAARLTGDRIPTTSKQIEGGTILLTRLPPKKTDLIGRQDDLNALEQRLVESDRVLLVNGLGGIGKTEMCKRFFYDHYREYSYAAWVDVIASVKESMVNSFAGRDDLFAVRDNFSIDHRFEKILHFFNALDKKTLLIFDNIENPEDPDMDELTRFPANVKVIANSRSSISGFDTFFLNFLSESGCKELFYRYYRMDADDETVVQLVNRCGLHTLTVELLARTAYNAGMGAEELLCLLKEKGFNLNDVIGEEVDTFWRNVKKRKLFFNHLLALFDLSGVTEEERNILINLSVLPAQYISMAVVSEWLGLENMNELNRLVRNGWLHRSDEKIFLHQVIQEVVRFHWPPNINNCGNLVKSLSWVLKVNPGENPLDKRELITFGEMVLNYIDDEHWDVAFLANELGLLFKAIGNPKQALIFLLKSLTIRKKILGDNHQFISTSYNNISNIYEDLGEVKIALEYQVKALNIDERTPLIDPIEIATTLNNISLRYKTLGETKKALEFQLRAIEVHEGRHVKILPELAKSYNNVSNIYGELGQLEQAMQFQLKSLSIREEILEANHPDLAQSYSNLGLIYQKYGQLDKSLEYLKKALAIDELTADLNHPDLATSYSNIAGIYKEQKDFEKALEYQEKAIDIQEKQLRIRHPKLATSYNNLAMIYVEMKQYSRSLEIQMKALAMRKELFGESHPDIANSYNNLSTIFYYLKQLDNARDYSQKAVDIMKEYYPEGHPHLDFYQRNLERLKAKKKTVKSTIPSKKKKRKKRR